MRHRPKKPSKTRRHRESVAAKRRARAFYRTRRGYGADVLPPDEAEAMRPWAGCGYALFAVVAVAVIGWAAAQIFS